MHEKLNSLSQIRENNTFSTSPSPPYNPKEFSPQIKLHLERQFYFRNNYIEDIAWSQTFRKWILSGHRVKSLEKIKPTYRDPSDRYTGERSLQGML